MSAWLVACLWILGTVGQVSAPQPPGESPQARIERWEESLQLDLANEVVAEAEKRVAPGGELAREGRAIACVARALAAVGERGRADALLKGASPTKDAGLLVECRARFALEDDELDLVIELLHDPARGGLRDGVPAAAGILLARARVRRAEWDLARPLLERFVDEQRLSPEAPSAWHLLALEALRRQDARRAQACAEREASLGRWHAYLKARRLQVRETPKEPLPRLGLAQLWLEVDELAAADRAIDELLEIAPDFARGWLARGETRRKQGRLPEASASYTRALELDSSLDIARFNRAQIARIEGRAADARSDLETLLAGKAGRDPRFASAHLELARLLRDAGDAEGARASYARYREAGGTEAL